MMEHPLPAINTIINADGEPIVYGMISKDEYPLYAECVCGTRLYRDSRVAEWEHVGQCDSGSRFDPPTQAPVSDDNPLKGLIEAFDAERKRVERSHR